MRLVRSAVLPRTSFKRVLSGFNPALTRQTHVNFAPNRDAAEVIEPTERHDLFISPGDYNARENAAQARSWQLQWPKATANRRGLVQHSEWLKECLPQHWTPSESAECFRPLLPLCCVCECRRRGLRSGAAKWTAARLRMHQPALPSLRSHCKSLLKPKGGSPSSARSARNPNSRAAFKGFIKPSCKGRSAPIGKPLSSHAFEYRKRMLS